jgi:hypothetical protein
MYICNILQLTASVWYWHKSVRFRKWELKASAGYHSYSWALWGTLRIVPGEKRMTYQYSFFILQVTVWRWYSVWISILQIVAKHITVITLLHKTTAYMKPMCLRAPVPSDHYVSKQSSTISSTVAHSINCTQHTTTPLTQRDPFIVSPENAGRFVDTAAVSLLLAWTTRAETCRSVSHVMLAMDRSHSSAVTKYFLTL